MPSVAGCVRFGRDSCGALHQMLAGVAQAEREHAWAYIERELACFESPTGFKGPYELLFASGHKVILAATGALAR